MDRIIKKLRITYIAIITTVAIATAIIVNTAETAAVSTGQLYTIEVINIALLITAIPLAIKGFDTAMQNAIQKNKKTFTKKYIHHSIIRISILSCITAINTGTYLWLQTEKQTLLYCGLIGAVALIYCYPTHRAAQSYIRKE